MIDTPLIESSRPGPRIGPYQLASQVILAPMAGITDAPFRRLCHDFGAGLTATEMTLASQGVKRTATPGSRLDFNGTKGIRTIQIAGSEPQQVAEAAREAEDIGAQIIDINMGCPAKKVCNKLAGSALLKDEDLVQRIIAAVVCAVSVPVTLKTRTGWDTSHRNGARIAKIAESEGISALAIHGRTRACGYKGEAEYETIRKIKSEVNIPVFANGDIESPQDAAKVLKMTNADGVMIGRGAQGQPWIFEQVSAFLAKKVFVPIPSIEIRRDIILSHLSAMHQFYGERIAVRVARKHISWYSKNLPNAEQFRFEFVRVKTASEQMKLTENFFIQRLQEH